MEKIMFFMAAIVACSSAAAEYEYMPLVQEGKVWEYQARDNGNQSDNVCMMEFRGDTLINDTTFKKLYFYDTKTLTSPQWPLAYMCEIDKKVYARINDAMCEALQKGPYNEYSIMRDYSETVLLYDFNNMAKQQFAGMPSSVTPAITKVEIDGYMRNKGVWKSDDGSTTVELIEGIGPNSSVMTLIKPDIYLKYVNGLTNLRGLKCVKNSRGEIIFKGCAYKEDGGSTGVTEITAVSGNTDKNIYSIDGRVVKTNADETEGLSQGIYIYQGKKIVVK